MIKSPNPVFLNVPVTCLTEKENAASDSGQNGR